MIFSARINMKPCGPLLSLYARMRVHLIAPDHSVSSPETCLLYAITYVCIYVHLFQRIYYFALDPFSCGQLELS